MVQTEAATRIFRVALHEDRRISRDIEIDGAKSLYHLAEAIVGAFDFDFDHAFGFYSGTTPRTLMEKQPKYELFTDLGMGMDMGFGPKAKSVKKTRLDKAFPNPGHAMTFLFDYGDEWLFRVEMTGSGQRAAKIRYPRVLERKGESPPQYPTFDDEEE
jgi:hypothetical protein